MPLSIERRPRSKHLPPKPSRSPERECLLLAYTELSYGSAPIPWRGAVCQISAEALCLIADHRLEDGSAVELHISAEDMVIPTVVVVRVLSSRPLPVRGWTIRARLLSRLNEQDIDELLYGPPPSEVKRLA